MTTLKVTRGRRAPLTWEAVISQLASSEWNFAALMGVAFLYDQL